MVTLRNILLSIAVAAVSTTWGCGDGSAPMAPGDGSPPPAETDVPSIPVPRGPGMDLPRRSETLNVIEPISGDFTPMVTAAPGQTVHLSGSFTYHRFPCENTRPLEGRGTGVRVGGTFPFTTSIYCGNGLVQAVNGTAIFAPGVARLWVDGAPNRAQNYSWRSRIDDATYVMNYAWTWSHTLADPPYLQRRRTWVLSPFPDGSTVKAVEGEGEVTITARHSTGTTTTQAQSWSRSLGGTIGLPVLDQLLSLSASLSETFETSVAVTTTAEVETSTRIQGQNGVLREARAWGLEEVYTFVHADGTPYSDPNFTFTGMNDALVRKGVETRLVVTDFAR